MTIDQSLEAFVGYAELSFLMHLVHVADTYPILS